MFIMQDFTEAVQTDVLLQMYAVSSYSLLQENMNVSRWYVFTFVGSLDQISVHSEEDQVVYSTQESLL